MEVIQGSQESLLDSQGSSHPLTHLLQRTQQAITLLLLSSRPQKFTESYKS